MATPTLSIATLSRSATKKSTNNNNNNNNNGKNVTSDYWNGGNVTTTMGRDNGKFDSLKRHSLSNKTAKFDQAKPVTLPDQQSHHQTLTSSKSNKGDTNNNNNNGSDRQRRMITEEINEDSIYEIHLKKITYTFNNALNKQTSNSKFVTRCDQVDYDNPKAKDKSNSKWYDDQQSLQWETRQLRTIKGATLEHLIQYILLLTINQSANSQTANGDNSYFGDNSDIDDNDDSSIECNSLLEERNNVAHAMHVIFATYRQYVFPWQLFAEITKQKPFSSAKQFNFILFYWLNNYPEDFWTACQPRSPNPESNLESNLENNNNNSQPTTTASATLKSVDNDDESSCSYSDYTSTSSSSSHFDYAGSSSMSSMVESMSVTSDQFSPLTLADQLISMRHINEEVKKHCLHLLDMKKEDSYSKRTLTHSSSIYKSNSNGKPSSILDLECKFIAQQLTSIDLEIFLTLKPYSLLSNQRTKTKIETMIRNFNLLSRHVVITILQHSTPQLVASHWIEVAHHLRKMRNFNSLKAIISGLTNESIYRLKATIWNKLSRASMSTFTYLSSIVDDVNNQTLLRHTQLFIEGTSKVSLEDSFGTVPYLGTFLTDITMINTRYPNYIKMENGKKLINFEKCSKQYEILTQMQLLQKNAIAALQQQQQSYQMGPIYSLNHYLSLRSQSVPSVPRVARIFRNWFQVTESELLSDRDCYQLSQSIEATPAKGKK